MPSAPSAKKCSYAGCKKPNESVHFFRIDGKGTAGGQVLCILNASGPAEGGAWRVECIRGRG
jgi:hypothetical protein